MDHACRKPQLIAPAGDWTSLRAALGAGADAVYFGAEGLNMRAASKNFPAADFAGIARLCHQKGAAAYLALNPVVYDAELDLVDRTVEAARNAGLDAVICWDPAVIHSCRKHGMPIHLSTQASVSNIAAVRFYASLGARMIVLARELDLRQVAEISSHIRREQLPVTLECFVHGAMCVAVSGRCFMSQELFGKSANRGECLQPCRRAYRITDQEEGLELELGTDHIMSPRDLCAIRLLDRIIDAGVGACKIEGRNRSPEYVATTTAAYRAAIDFVAAHRAEATFTDAFDKLAGTLEADLAKVYNRGFSNGFYLGRPAGQWARQHGSAATETKVYIGVVRHYYPKAGVAEILVHSRGVSQGETLSIQGPATGLVTVEATPFHLDDAPAEHIGKGNLFTVRCERVRKNDTVYVLAKK